MSAQTFPKGATYASEQARALEKAKQDVAGGADDVNLLCYNACRNGHVDAAKWLVGEGGADINIARNNGITPLYIACEKGQMAGGQRHGRRRRLRERSNGWRAKTRAKAAPVSTLLITTE